MATPGISTNDPLGLGYQTGLFSGPVGQPIDQAFLNAAINDRRDKNKHYREAFQCMVGECGMATWLDEFAGYETDCSDHTTLLEYYGYRHQIRANAGVTIPAYPATGQIILSAKDHFVSGNYVLPQLGEAITLPPSGDLADIVLVTHGGAGDTVITVKKRQGTSGTSVIPAGAEMLVLSGKMLEDCACPTGQFRLPDLPIEHDLDMIYVGDKGELCGDAIESCQYIYIPFLAEDGSVVSKLWYTEPQKEMYRGLRKREQYESLLNPNWGIIPTIKARGVKFTPASSTAITTDDVRAWKKGLDLVGNMNREFAVFAGNEIYSQFMQMLGTAGVTNLNYTEQPMGDCKWLNMDWCGMIVEGLKLHIYDECTFSNGKGLGAAGMVYPNSAIFFPMGETEVDSVYLNNAPNRMIGAGEGTKMFTRVYYRSIQGKTYDMDMDSNGLLNGPGGRNTYGTGCRQHSWTVQSRFYNVVKCAQNWGYIGL